MLEFKLSQEQFDKYVKWREEKVEEVYVGAVGGAYSFVFTLTGIGDIVKVKCADGTELDLTEWEYF